MTSQPEHPETESSLTPSDAEIEAWAARERRRRQQWLSGPTPEQAAVSVSRERERVDAERGRTHRGRGSDDDDAVWLVRRSLRTAQLAAEGAMSLLWNVSLREVHQRLVQAGLEWEEELLHDARGGGRATPSRQGTSALPEPAHEPD
jgi:hypothetical protein